MASDRKQINVRMDDETAGWLAELAESMRVALGINVTRTDVFKAALAELRKKYPPPAKPAPRGRGRKEQP